MVLGVGKDITEHKQAEEALRRSEATYREIFNAANDGILVLDIETGEIVDANATFLNVFGYTTEEARGLRVGDFSSGTPAYAQQNALRLIRKAARGQPQRFEWLAKSRDGRLMWIDVALKPTTISGQDRVLAIGRDLTERKQAEEALEKAREELEARVERQMEQGNPYGLTFRELTVLHQVAAGKADKEIGLELGISPLTASKHLTNILGKMGAASRTEAGVRALREGLLD